MKLLIILVSISSMLSFALAFFNMQDATLLADRKWQRFKSFHGRKYKNLAEERKRRAIWQENSKFIESHNIDFEKGKYTYHCGMNEFGDMTNDEYKRTMTMCKPTHFQMTMKNRNKNIHEPKNLNLNECSKQDELPKSIDWRIMGAVTEVKDQGNDLFKIYLKPLSISTFLF